MQLFMLTVVKIMDHDKKISFGFSKLSKKPAVTQNKHSKQEKVELVECLEGQSIKIKDAPEIVNEPLVIPILDNKKNLLDRVKYAKAKQKQLAKKEAEQEDNRPDSELTIDELAARELINDARNRSSNEKLTKGLLTLPMKDDNSTFDGEKEPTLDDYEKIPVNDYGMAMLRGMGWKEGMGIGRNPIKMQPANVPDLRPKGLGLGANRMVNVEIPKEPIYDKDGKMLVIKKGTYAKIIAGSHKGKYCEVQGLDDEAGRVIVRTSLKGEILTLNEFLIVPITKEEYFKEAKVLNNVKFEEYREMSSNNFENHLKAKGTSSEATEEHSSRRKLKEENGYYRKSGKHETEREHSEEDNKYSKDKCHSKHERQSRYRKKEGDSISSDSDSNDDRKRRTKKKQTYCRNRSRSSESKHKSKSENLKSKHEGSSSSDHQRRVSSKKNKTKSRHGRSSSSDSDTYRKNRR